MTRFWDWFIITVKRRCVICDGELEGGYAAVKAHYRGEITLCRWCREALDKAGRLTYSSLYGEKPELSEAFDIETANMRGKKK